METTKSGWKCLKHTPSESKTALRDFLIFHGYGAGAEDLVFLQSLYPPGRWFFPNAFLNSKGVPSWFRGDTEAYIQSLQSNQPIENPFFQTNGDVLQLIEELELQPERLIMGGFSQGALLSALLFLRHFTPKALILLSGGMAPEKDVSLKDGPPAERKDQRGKVANGPLKANSPLKKDSSFPCLFQSHGLFDDILPFISGKNLFNTLTARGCRGEFHSFPGGHEVPPEILEKLKNWLNRLP